jgi:ABC-2 type transport system ATP-binding protein
MPQEEPIKQFVAGALERGMARKDIRAILLKAGWPKEMVDDYVRRSGIPLEVDAPILRCHNLCKKHAGIEDISLEIAKGELFAIVGLGGSGKSTLMHMLAGLDVPDAGDVQLLIDGKTRSIVRDPTSRRKTGFSFQVPSVFNDLTAAENIEQFADLYGLRHSAQRAPNLLKLVGLANRATVKAGHLSAGERKRLDIAAALVNDPAVLFIDDPASELDVYQQRQLWSLLRDLTKKGTTIVIASDFLAELEAVCDRMGILRNGRIAEVGRPDDLRVVYSRNYEIRLRTQNADYAQLGAELASAGAQKISVETGTIRVSTANPAAALRVVLDAIGRKGDQLISIEIMRPTIQEVFESLSP